MLKSQYAAKRFPHIANPARHRSAQWQPPKPIRLFGVPTYVGWISAILALTIGMLLGLFFP